MDIDPLENTSKVVAVDKLCGVVFRRTHRTLFLVLILIAIFVGIPMLCLNYISSLGNPLTNSSITKPNNSFPLALLKCSSFSAVYYSDINAYIQEFILIGLLVFSLISLVLMEAWVNYVGKTYKERISPI